MAGRKGRATVVLSTEGGDKAQQAVAEFVDGIGGIEKQLAKANKALDNGSGNISRYATVAEQEFKRVRKAIEDGVEPTDEQRAALERLENQFADTKVRAKEFNEQLGATKRELGETSGAATKAATDVGQVGDSAKRTGPHIVELTGRLTIAIATIKELSEQAQPLLDKMNQLTEAAGRGEGTWSKWDLVVPGVTANLSHFADSVEKTGSAWRALTEDGVPLLDRLQNAWQATENLTTAEQKLAPAVEATRQRLKARRDELEASRAAAEAHRTELDAHRATYEAIIAKLDPMRERLADLAEQRAKLTAAHSAGAVSDEEFATAIALLDVALGKLTVTVEKLPAAQKKATDATAEGAAAHDKAAKSVKGHDAALAALKARQDAATAATDRVAEAQKKVDELRAQENLGPLTVEQQAELVKWSDELSIAQFEARAAIRGTTGAMNEQADAMGVMYGQNELLEVSVLKFVQAYVDSAKRLDASSQATLDNAEATALAADVNGRLAVQMAKVAVQMDEVDGKVGKVKDQWLVFNEAASDSQGIFFKLNAELDATIARLERVDVLTDQVAGVYDEA